MLLFGCAHLSQEAATGNAGMLGIINGGCCSVLEAPSHASASHACEMPPVLVGHAEEDESDDERQLPQKEASGEQGSNSGGEDSEQHGTSGELTPQSSHRSRWAQGGGSSTRVRCGGRAPLAGG